jgi:hypothetical protein
MSKRIDLKVELNSRIVDVMKGFIPRVGSNEDIKIVETYTKLLNLETLKMDSITRANKAGRQFKPLQVTLDNIEQVEKTLLWLMNKRK